MPNAQPPHGCVVVVVTFVSFFGGALIGAVAIKLLQPQVFGAAAFFFMPLVFVGAIVVSTIVMGLMSLWALLTGRRKLFSTLPSLDDRDEQRAQTWLVPGAFLSSLIQGAILALWAPDYLVAVLELTVLGTAYGAVMMMLARKRLLPLGAFFDWGQEPF